MSFMDTYRKALKGEQEQVTPAKKTTSVNRGGSFMDTYRQTLQTVKKDNTVTTVSPTVTTRKKKDERKWFEKGAFEDGYQLGDVSKTILGTLTDTAENIGSGILGMGETALDALAYLGNAAAKGQYYQNGGGYNIEQDKLFEEQHKEATKATQEFIKKDLYDEEAVAKAIISDPVKFLSGIDAEEDSVFGEKTDSLVQSGGQLLATAGLQAVGVPWFLTTGATSFGAEAENALNQGATYEQAGLSAAISAGAEILTEKLSGGIKFGGKALDDVLTKQIATGISNKLGRSLAKIGLDMVGEGAEEVFSQVASNLGSSLYKEEGLWELLTNEEAIDGYIESFIGGAALGGVAGSVNAIKSNKNGVDYATELTANEEAVVNKVYEDRLAEAEENGKLSQREKTKIYEQVLNDLDKGYLSTDTIESVLAEEKFQPYKETLDEEKSIREELEAYQTEYDSLSKKETLTLDETVRKNELTKLYAEAKAKLDDTGRIGKRDYLKASLSQEVYELTKSDRLVESYFENTRRGQKFEADLSQYDENQQKIVQKAIDSGILNNSNRTHEFVDIIAKISADKGVLFDFTNNKKLKESGFAVDGKQVNGFVTKDGITLNMDSPKAWQSTVGHEITHVLEGTELYDSLKSTIFEYAKSKGEYESKLSNLTKTYKGMDADIEAELAADLVGEYLFQDADFVNHLSTQNRNVFQKIYDEIKYLYKVVTAGSKEARELEKVKRAFDKAYKEGAKVQGETKYSLDMVDAVQPKSDKWSRTHTTEEAMARFPNMWNVAAEESEVRNPTQITSTVNSYRKIYNFLQNEGFNGTILDASSGLGYGTRAGIEEYGFDVEDIEPYPDKGYQPKYQDYSALDKKYDVIISNAVLNVLPQDQRDALAVKMGEMLNNGGRLFVNVRGKDVETLAKTGKNIHLGNMEWIETVKGSYQKGFTKPELVAYLEDALGDGFTVKPTNMFGAVSAVVTKDGAKYSLSDSDGKELTKEQQEYFKDSKMRDDEGNLKVMYHGSQDAGFHVFDASMSDDDTSFFFVDRNDVAASYSGTSETYEAKTIRTAEDMNNFMAEIGADGYEVVEQDGEFILLYDGDRVAASDTAQGIYKEFCWYEGVGEGDANYKVYLNLTNPLEVDAQGRNWNNVSREFSQEIADRYHSLTAEEKAALHDLTGWGEISIFRDAKRNPPDAVVASAFEKLGDANIYDQFSIAEDNFSDLALEAWAVNQMNTRDYAQKAKAEGYDGVIFKNIVDVGGYGGDYTPSTVAIAFDSNQIKSVANEKPTKDADIRYSLSNAETDRNYLDAVNNGDNETARKIMEQVAKRRGYNIRAYHGTARGDRVGNVFLPERATSGPMAFFTSNKEIAENYSKSKQDTSMAYDPDYDRYETQFRIKVLDRDVPLYRAWGYLPFDARRRITTKAGQLRENWDGDNELILDPETNEANGGFQWQLKEARGNAIQALTEQWLNSGTLFNEEGRFLDVLEMAGVTEEFKKVKGMGELYFKDPNAKHEKVYDAFLKIKDPFDTANADEQFAADLEAWYEEQDQSKYVRESMESDLWDKNSIDAYDFVERVRSDLENNTTHAWTSIPDSVTDYLKSLGYDGIKDTGGKFTGDLHTVWIPFASSQIKSAETVTYDDAGKVIPITERFNKRDVDIRYSLYNIGEKNNRYGNFATPARDLRIETAPTVSKAETVAPVQKTRYDLGEMFPNNLAPVQKELEELNKTKETLEQRMSEAIIDEDIDSFTQATTEYESVMARIEELEGEENQRTDSLTDSDVPPEMDAPYTEATNAAVENPFEGRDWYSVGNQKVKAYMYEHPEVKPFFQAEAQNLLGELTDTQKGEKWYNDEVYYESGGEKGWGGQKRLTSRSMETLLDEWGMSYADIEKGLKAIIEDNGAENIAAAKKIEFMLNDRLLNGYKNFYDNGYVEPNQEYINLLEEMQINSYSKESFDAFMATADQYAPIASVKPLKKPTPDTMTAPLYESKDPTAPRGQTTLFEPPKPNPKVATVLTEETAIAKEKSGIGGKLVTSLVDKGIPVENLSLKTGNQELQAKYNYALPTNTEARAQYLMENGTKGVKSLKDIKTRVEKTGKENAFFDYMYHVHNIDRMTLQDRFDNAVNKPVFGETVTADVSRKKIAKYEKQNPEFKSIAEDVYKYNRYLRQLLVKEGVISPKTSALWQKMYPHYVPIRRVDSKGQNISVPLDTNKTGVNNPIKRATGGSSDITPLFNTMAQRTEQTYRAIARNAFGIELKNTLGSTINSRANTTGVDEVIDTLVQQEDKLLKPGTMTTNPTFTVFENGERVEFEITEELFDSLKPAGKLLGYRNKAVKAVGDARRNLLTVWNPVFALYRNPIKDIQDVAINSQHPLKTYLNVPNAIYQMATDGQYAEEYHRNGGKSNTYFDSRKNEFKKEDNIFKKTIGMPVKAIETMGEFIEEIPRLAEYIASRQDGRSVERAMLDAARVTTNFAAGGDFTKFLNSHGFTFLNASVQGASQHVRNFREAKLEGLKGYVKVAAKYLVAGLPVLMLNGIWDDDEDYEELSDYVKQNYYIVAKTQDGKFVRVPKGRTAAVMQNLFQQMENLVTGDDEADFGTFFELFMDNIAPNNPIDNNILAPVVQTLSNNAWYGGDIVPSRLQDLPAEEQYDESTDSISKWLGENIGGSPYKWNYLIDQYSGGLGDVFLPMLTPEAESGDNSFVGNMLAPWKKEITTDSVLNNKHPGDFYDLRDELEKKANSSKATEDDAMRKLYMDSVSWDMSDLYNEKREIQNSDMPDSVKYNAVRSVQERINALAENALNAYNDISVTGLYAEVGDRRFNKDAETGKWYEIQETNADGSANYYYEKEQEVTQALGITPAEYWNNREEYNYAYDKPEQYALAKTVGGYQSYQGYIGELWDIKADKDENGKSISGSRKEKVINYLNDMDADYYTKIILFKNEYNADDTYNYEIIDYLNSREDISYEEMETILKYLGFDVDSNGNISW